MSANFRWRFLVSHHLSIEGDAMKLRPLHDRVIVKRLEQETKTASGIVIPDNAAEKPDQGEVTAVGPGRKNDKGEIIALNVKVGDRVLFGKYSGQTVKVDGDELLVMKEDDLFAVVEGSPAAGLKKAA
jgi:chaperonin GroES